MQSKTFLDFKGLENLIDYWKGENDLDEEKILAIVEKSPDIAKVFYSVNREGTSLFSKLMGSSRTLFIDYKMSLFTVPFFFHVTELENVVNDIQERTKEILIEYCLMNYNFPESEKSIDTLIKKFKNYSTTFDLKKQSILHNNDYETIRDYLHYLKETKGKEIKRYDPSVHKKNLSEAYFLLLDTFKHGIEELNSLNNIVQEYLDDLSNFFKESYLINLNSKRFASSVLWSYINMGEIDRTKDIQNFYDLIKSTYFQLQCCFDSSNLDDLKDKNRFRSLKAKMILCGLILSLENLLSEKGS
ncbi:MAG: hypothetical protein QW524_02420 [Candidatus Woesearchaeota archaeon]